MKKRRYGRRFRKKSLYKQVKSNKRAISKLKADAELKFIYGTATQPLDYQDLDASMYFFNTDIYRDVDTPAGGGNVVLDDIDKRQGNVINNKTLFIRGYFDNKNGPTTPEDVLCRIIIGKWIDNSAGTMGGNNIVHASTDINTPYNIDNNGIQNYKILFDHTFPMDHVNYQLIPFKARFILKDRTVYEGQTTAQVETAVRRNLYFMMLRSTASAAAHEPDFHFTYKFAYTDQ